MSSVKREYKHIDLATRRNELVQLGDELLLMVKALDAELLHEIPKEIA